MGYRSDVSFCLQVKDPEQFVALMKLKDDEVLKEMLDCMWLSEDLLHFHHHHWKWYPDSEQAFGDLMNMAEKYDPDFACRFARVGENADDVIEESFGEGGWDLDYPYVVRHLEVGFDSTYAKKLIEEEKEDVSA